MLPAGLVRRARTALMPAGTIEAWDQAARSEGARGVNNPTGGSVTKQQRSSNLAPAACFSQHKPTSCDIEDHVAFKLTKQEKRTCDLIVTKLSQAGEASKAMLTATRASIRIAAESRARCHPATGTRGSW